MCSFYFAQLSNFSTDLHSLGTSPIAPQVEHQIVSLESEKSSESHIEESHKPTAENRMELDEHGGNDEEMPYFDLQEWAQHFKALRSICFIYKNAEKFEQFIETMTEENNNAEMNRRKNWFIEVRNNLDKLTEGQMEDFMYMARKNWLYLEAREPKVVSNSSQDNHMKTEVEASSDDNQEKEDDDDEDDKPPTPPSRPAPKLAGKRPAMKSAPSKGKGGKSQVANKMEMSREIKAALDEAWFKHLYLLFHYESLHGNINAPVNEVMVEDGVEYKIGEWLLTQRELLDYLRENDYEKYDILVSLVTERGLWMTKDDNYKPRQHDFGKNDKNSRNAVNNKSVVNSKVKPNNKRSVSKVAVDSDDNQPPPRKVNVSKTAESKGGTRKVVATKSVPASKPKATKVRTAVGKKKKGFESDEESSASEEDHEESEESEEEVSEEERVVAPKKAMTTGRITPRSTKSQAPPKPEPKTRKVRRTSSKKLSANETESEAESHHSGSDNSGSEAETIPRGKGKAKSIRQDKQTAESSSSQKDRRGLDHSADSKGINKMITESITDMDVNTRAQPMPRTFGSSIPREAIAGSSPQSVHQNDDSTSRSTRSRFNKSNSTSATNAFPQHKRYDYAAFIYAVDDSNDVYLGIGMVTTQYVEDGCMTFNMQVLKSVDPKKFLQSDFKLQQNESATVRSQHIAVSDIKFIGGKFLVLFSRILTSSTHMSDLLNRWYRWKARGGFKKSHLISHEKCS